MQFADIGTVAGKYADCAVRWDESTGVVEIYLFRFLLEGEPHWDWVRVGAAQSQSLALGAAQNWLRGDLAMSSPQAGRSTPDEPNENS
jgi:hypothetical protein